MLMTLTADAHDARRRVGATQEQLMLTMLAVGTRQRRNS